ncbi:MAG: hypothetical protein AAGE59_10595 [Cyanobacteria bacterium P01_F01_bin.86]
MEQFLHSNIPGIITNVAGWIPAVVLPTATISQLVKIVQSKSAEGVSLVTWLLFGIANVGLYIFTEKYFSLQSLIGLLGTAIMDFIIVAMIVFIKVNKPAEASSSSASGITNRDSKDDLGGLSGVEQNQ